jgi:amidohydrolase
VSAGPSTAELVDRGFAEVLETRHALHARPELSFEEHETTAVIRERMRALGADERPCPTATGGLFVIDGGLPGRTVLLRADIDALPIEEANDHDWRSRASGRMHACGHDAHTAMLLGVARVLAAQPPGVAGRYVFVFQPGEERLAGARAMIEGGLLEAVSPERVIGCHVVSHLPAGLVMLRTGVAMSDGQGLRFELRGPGGHGARPGAAGDVIAAVVALVGALPEVVAGMEHEGTPAVCSAGILHAGTACNVLPATAVVEGTLRTFTAEQKACALDRLAALCERIADERGVAVTPVLTMHAPAVVNDVGATQLVRDAAEQTLGARGVLAGPPVAPSDDVSEFLRRVPGCFFLLGAARADGTSGMHHSPAFDIEEEAMRAGVRILSARDRARAGCLPPRARRAAGCRRR